MLALLLSPRPRIAALPRHAPPSATDGVHSPYTPLKSVSTASVSARVSVCLFDRLEGFVSINRSVSGSHESKSCQSRPSRCPTRSVSSPRRSADSWMSRTLVDTWTIDRTTRAVRPAGLGADRTGLDLTERPRRRAYSDHGRVELFRSQRRHSLTFQLTPVDFLDEETTS